MTVSDRFSVSNYSHYQQFGHFTERGAHSGYGFNYAYHNETLPIYFIFNSWVSFSPKILINHRSLKV